MGTENDNSAIEKDIEVFKGQVEELILVLEDKYKHRHLALYLWHNTWQKEINVIPLGDGIRLKMD
jgi:hypothetical protein